MTEEQRISFKQLVEARKQEMQSMLPGLMSEVTDGEHTMKVYSPSPLDKVAFKIAED